MADIALAALVVALAYLWGSIPTAYIAGRFTRGIDLRQYGSGNVGGSNIWVHVGRLIFVPVALFDVSKGLLWVAIPRVLGLGTTVEVAAAIAAIVGHNWSAYLGFTGGRGIGVTLGAMALLEPRTFFLVSALIALGILLRKVPLTVGLTIGFSPLLAWLLHRSPSISLGFLAMALIMVAKRLLGNRNQYSPPGEKLWRILLFRLLFDRDIADRREWIHRTPSSPSSE